MFDLTTRYKEYGFLHYEEYAIEDRILSSQPKKNTMVAFTRPTFFKSLLETLVHTLKQGENFHQLSLKYYGDARYWWFIADYNPLLDPLYLVEGNEVIIPPPTEVSTYSGGANG